MAHHITLAHDSQTALVTERTGKPQHWDIRELRGSTLVLGQHNKCCVSQIRERLGNTEVRAILVVET